MKRLLNWLLFIGLLGMTVSCIPQYTKMTYELGRTHEAYQLDSPDKKAAPLLSANTHSVYEINGKLYLKAQLTSYQHSYAPYYVIDKHKTNQGLEIVENASKEVYYIPLTLDAQTLSLLKKNKQENVSKIILQPEHRIAEKNISPNDIKKIGSITSQTQTNPFRINYTGLTQRSAPGYLGQGLLPLALVADGSLFVLEGGVMLIAAPIGYVASLFD